MDVELIKKIKTKKMRLKRKKINSRISLIKVLLYPLILIIFLVSYYLYFLSLEACTLKSHICSIKFEWINKKIKEGMYSSFLLIFLIELMILKVISKKHLIHIFIMFLLFYKYSHGINFRNHGLFNFIGSISIIIIGLFILIPINIFIFLIQKKKLYIILYGLFFLSQIILLKISFDTYINCNDWPKGLNNTYIINDVNIYGCQIEFPKLCLYKIGKYFLDRTKITKYECGKKKNTKDSFIRRNRNITKNTKRIGFPLTTKDEKYFKNYYQFFLVGTGDYFRHFIKDIFDMDNKEQIESLKDYPEIEVDYTNNPNGEMKINLTFNETLSKIRKEKENNSNPYSNNIMIIYIDSVSRNNALRQLKKTLNFFENFMSYKGGYNSKYPSEIFHSFQFFKYQAFIGHTANNYPKLFYGSNGGRNIKRITKYFKENGYVTCLSNSECLREAISFGHHMKSEEICDHEFTLCDPNLIDLLASLKRCLYSKISTFYLLEYGNQFWRKYESNRKFFLIAIDDGHEGKLETLKYSDDIIFTFLNNLYNDNLLKETTIFLLSDHGVNLPSPYYFLNFYYLESYLPMLYIIVNDRKNILYEEQYKYIYENQQTFITGYDIYNTIVHLLYGDNYNSIQNKTKPSFEIPKTTKGESLFIEINQKLKTSNTYKDMAKDVCIDNNDIN